MSIRIRDTDNTRNVINSLNQMNKKIVIGFFREDGEYSSDTHLNVVDLAKIHEFGVDIKVTRQMRKWFVANGYPLSKSTNTITLPERAFLRNAFDNNLSKINEKIDIAVERIKGLQENPDSVMDELANEITEILKADIDLGGLSSKLRHEVRDE